MTVTYSLPGHLTLTVEIICGMRLTQRAEIPWWMFQGLADRLLDD